MLWGKLLVALPVVVVELVLCPASLVGIVGESIDLSIELCIWIVEGIRDSPEFPLRRFLELQVGLILGHILIVPVGLASQYTLGIVNHKSPHVVNDVH
jgi:hypothetical protein